ncbi:glutathionylspermidine synthase family protein [Pseudoteredinibacter isoporae]|uniref:Glutathionylspermidine synthase n=1 Tax=Pseudoteredinibacter isoporae TaxID=570281 RepID=A0A7X0JXB4_9GAMM|nr:glutathionylspermidine synthase family protein [Pseudoteredinibacter isoporae]MBB6523121.1 glutathionylspermidine synthase [Pseudoteredinibacter isoporae]NHO88641.1 glutathionylspermidine synthase family protein [Pseudoteredinibacter isoporae]NIB22668.1 glutathionylspermidine synthase family protein [Pseudoteredinibacter isoporae]
MRRVTITERPDWKELAEEYGFHFHTMYGEPYWQESAYYEFSLEQVEADLEDPSEQLQTLCLEAVDEVLNRESWLQHFQIPEQYWDWIKHSWERKDPSLYSRFDLCYDGKSDAKLLENNADTPTSLYESGFWQWLWLEQQIERGALPSGSDQFNSLQDKLIERFHQMRNQYGLNQLAFSSCLDTEEDRATVQYLQDCATEAGIKNTFCYVEEIGLNEDQQFCDHKGTGFHNMFKLYPWEFMLREEFGPHLLLDQCQWFEPPWKAILSNKAILPILWKMFPGHKHLLPAFFSEKEAEESLDAYVKKPIFSREGANISIIKHGQEIAASYGPYGEEGFIYQAYQELPKFEDNYTLIGSWIVGNQAAGISIREDKELITQDLSRYLPHVIRN